MRVDGPDTVSVTPSGSTHVVNEGKVLDDITCTAECVRMNGRRMRHVLEQKELCHLDN